MHRFEDDWNGDHHNLLILTYIPRLIPIPSRPHSRSHAPSLSRPSPPSSERFVHNNVCPSQLLLYRNRSQEYWPLVGDRVHLLYDLPGGGNYAKQNGKHIVKGVVVALHDEDPNLYKLHLNNIADEVLRLTSKLILLWYIVAHNAR